MERRVHVKRIGLQMMLGNIACTMEHHHSTLPTPHYLFVTNSKIYCVVVVANIVCSQQLSSVTNFESGVVACVGLGHEATDLMPVQILKEICSVAWPSSL